MDQTETNAIQTAMAAYFDGLHKADSAILETVFHRDARYVNTTPGDYMNYNMLEYFAVVDGRTPAAPDEDTHNRSQDHVESIEFGGPNMAFVKASMAMMGRTYTDFLTFYKEDGRWQIIAKVFHYKLEG